MRLTLFTILLSILVLLSACNGSGTATVSSTNQSHEQSGGLGLTKGEWEARYGTGQSPFGTATFYRVSFDQNAYVVLTGASSDALSRVQLVQLHASLAHPSEDEIRHTITQILPADSALIKRGSPSYGRDRSATTDVFVSKYLDTLENSLCDSGGIHDSIDPGTILVTQERGGNNSTLLITIRWNCVDINRIRR